MNDTATLTPAARSDLAYHLHPSTNMRQVESEGPLVVTRGEGVYVFDEHGNRYLEGMAGLWCASLGFSERRLAEAAYRQMTELPFYHAFAGKVPSIATELAEKLVSMAPAGLARVIFANSGSEANDTAIKLAWYYNNALGRPEKKKIIGRQKGYHGMTVASASVTGLAFVHADFDLPEIGRRMEVVGEIAAGGGRERRGFVHGRIPLDVRWRYARRCHAFGRVNVWIPYVDSVSPMPECLSPDHGSRGLTRSQQFQ